MERKETMTIELIKRMMDTCYLAKRARDMLPPLPDGVMPSYIQYLDAIQKLEAKGLRVKVLLSLYYIYVY